MTTMDTRIIQATTLARMGLTDDQISQVLRIGEQSASTPPAPSTAAPAPLPGANDAARRSYSVTARANKRYAPLLAAMRADVVRAGGFVVSTLRDMTAPHEALLKSAAPNPGSPTSLRGLASLVGNARTRWGGVVGGMRFTATGDVVNHQTNYVYRVEAV